MWGDHVQMYEGVDFGMRRGNPTEDGGRRRQLPSDPQTTLRRSTHINLIVERGVDHDTVESPRVANPSSPTQRIATAGPAAALFTVIQSQNWLLIALLFIFVQIINYNLDAMCQEAALSGRQAAINLRRHRAIERDTAIFSSLLTARTRNI